MNGEIRKDRTVGVTQKITTAAARNLWVLSNSETWSDLLDCLERACIEIETNLINTPAADSSAVLENHKLAQAAWVIFESMQNKVMEASRFYLSDVAPQPVIPKLTAEEQERDYLLNPTNFPDTDSPVIDGI